MAGLKTEIDMNQVPEPRITSPAAANSVTAKANTGGLQIPRKYLVRRAVEYRTCGAPAASHR
jgi:hypothetical protein